MKPRTIFLLISFLLCTTVLLYARSDGARQLGLRNGQSWVAGNRQIGNLAWSRHARSSRQFFVPAHVTGILKKKCFLCHSSHNGHGGFDLKAMRYRTTSETAWQPMDWAGATRIKLAILPINGEPPRMPKRFQSTWHPLTQEEMNAIAAWTDYPFEE